MYEENYVLLNLYERFCQLIYVENQFCYLYEQTNSRSDVI